MKAVLVIICMVAILAAWVTTARTARLGMEKYRIAAHSACESQGGLLWYSWDEYMEVDLVEGQCADEKHFRVVLKKDSK